jgi:uncharacterized protein (TIGR04255 family)
LVGLQGEHVITLELKNKPLVEAILEVKWRVGNAPAPDPHYQLLLGRLYDRLQQDYPTHVALPTAQLPTEVAAQAGVVQHQLRPAPEDWPLVQIGPGVMSVNVTEKYSWPDFGPRCRAAVDALYAVHPSAGELHITSTMLRYIDAIDFDFTSLDALGFLAGKLKISVDLAQSLFDGTGVDRRASEIDVNLTFPSAQPRGRVRLRLVSGKRNQKPALIWETMVISRGRDVPTMPTGFDDWLESAHGLTHDWFFKMIEGELHERFSNG